MRGRKVRKPWSKHGGTQEQPLRMLHLYGTRRLKTLPRFSFERAKNSLLEKGSRELPRWQTFVAAKCTGLAISRQLIKAAATSLRQRLPSVGWQPRKAASTSSVVCGKAFEQRAEETFLLLSAASTVSGAGQPRATETTTFEPNLLPQRRLTMPLLGKGSFQLPVFAP